MAKFIEVVLNVPLNQTFTYYAPQEENSAQAGSSLTEDSVAAESSGTDSPQELFGKRVEVPFGNRKMVGIIVDSFDTLDARHLIPPEKIRSAKKFIDKTAVLTPELFSTARWMTHYYISSIGESVFSMIPSGKRETDAGGFSFSGDEMSFEKKALSQEQETAVQGITAPADSDSKANLHYLYGMTGSGKTEVFLSSAEVMLSRGKGVIYLVPEIGLTPQVVEAVVKRFGNTAAVIHSELTPSQRLGEWKRILSKEARIVVGARSAVFAPVPDLGMIIIDEEHDGSYKSGSSPRYHARQVAIYRSMKLGIPLVMGSATPSVEAWHLMESGRIQRHTLTRRLAGGAMPEIKSVNMSMQKNTSSCLSRELLFQMKATLANNRQIILFLNRRGFTHFFRCNSCGFEMKCRNCSVSLTYHKSENRLRCHYCGYSVQPPQQCPQCGSMDVGYFGFGTEYIESEVRAKFPHARVLRLDTDSITKKGELKDKIDAFRNGDYDILLGTQMVAKGLNFPRLQLVGVVLADTSLHLPDFRASERTFSLLTQVAGRAGRFFPDGKVIVQSFSPDREPIALAVSGDIETFYKKELEQRQMLGFPPYERLLRLVFRSAVPNAAQVAANGACSILRQHRFPDTDILGPADCPIEMIGQNFRQQILLRSPNISHLQEMAEILVRGYSAPKNVYIEVDVDPVNML